MKAVQFSEFGGPEVLHVSDVEEPHAGPGQIRVAVRGAGVNPMDWKVRSGAMQQFMPIELPSIPGSEVAGVVDEVGDGVTDVAVGDEVFGFAVGGGAAEHGVPVSGGAAERSWDALGQAARLSEAGEFTMPVERAFPFDQAPEAHRISEDGHVRGKLVLVPD